MLRGFSAPSTERLKELAGTEEEEEDAEAGDDEMNGEIKKNSESREQDVTEGRGPTGGWILIGMRGGGESLSSAPAAH